MKRNLLLLAVMVTAVFGFSSFAMAQCNPNDYGVCDTLYVEVFPGDNSVMPGQYPHFAKFPILMTHDIVVDTRDSIAGIVIPICYTHTNTATWCSVSNYWNTTGFAGPPAARSIFRHLPGMNNWQMARYLEYLGEEWDTKILNLGDEVSQFWMSLVPSGSADRRFEGGSRVLMATITFRMGDSTTICMDSCFWPPSSRLAWSNSDATTFIPQIWDDYYGTEVQCTPCTTIKNIPPYFSTCPPAENKSVNGAFQSQQFVAQDDDGTVNSVTAVYVGPPGGASVPVPPGDITFTIAPPAAIVTGVVNYTVANHCLPGGVVTLTCVDNATAPNIVPCTFPINLSNNPPAFTYCPANATVAYNDGFHDLALGQDADNDAFDFFKQPGSPGAMIVQLTGEIDWATGFGDVSPTPYNVTVRVTDVCGAFSDCNFTITVTNQPPVVSTCPDDGEVCVDETFLSTPFSATDPNQGPPFIWAITDVNPVPDKTMPYIVGNQVKWDVHADEVADIYTITLEVTDECGESATCDFEVDVKKFSADVELPMFGETGKLQIHPGDFVKYPVWLTNLTPIGGFELEIEFEYVSLCFVRASRGWLIDRPTWEFFTYRLLPCPIPPCQKYKILVYGQADVPNASVGTAIPVGGPHSLVYLEFVVANDENLRGYCIPIGFEFDPYPLPDPCVAGDDWDCEENTLSDSTGNLLFVSDNRDQYRHECCHQLPDTLRVFPVVTFGGPGGICIYDGGPSFGKRGDVNNNDLPYEVADAVLFANYFVAGVGVFVHNPDEQIAATDVNADGRPLTLSDLMYLIRVILNDAVAIPKLAPSSDVANVIVYNNTITTECASPIGAILFEFDGAVVPTLLADMEMANKDNKVLVWSKNGNTITTVEVLRFAGDAELVSVKAVGYDTRELLTSITAKVAPTAFALNPAYPNPFNPFTNLSFTLPEAVNYSLKIYNVAGQMVRGYEGSGSVGLNVVTWDGKDNAGVDVASGIYFCKLAAGSFSATQKMVMMK